MNPNETPASIFAWAQATFNKPDIRKTASRGWLEVAELVVNSMHGKPNVEIAAELADVTVMLWQVAHQRPNAVSAKLDFNREYDFTDFLPTAPALVHEISLLWACLLASLDLCHYNYAEAAEEDFKTNTESNIDEIVGGLLFATDQLAQCLGVELQLIVDTKMQVNRSRQWKMDAHGHAQHI